MNTREVVLITGALLIVGLLTTIVMHGLTPATESPTKAEKTYVLVAAHELSVNTPFSDNDLTWKLVSTKGLDHHFITQATLVKEAYLGRVARVPIHVHQPIEEALLQPERRMGEMARLIQPGKYAVTMIINRTEGNTGFIEPGDRINVILTRQVTNEPTSQKTYASQTILAHTTVLAVGMSILNSLNNVDKTSVPSDTLTLEVTSQQAELLALARATGDLSYTLNAGLELPRRESSQLYSWTLNGTMARPTPITEYHGDRVIVSGETTQGAF